MNGLPNSVLYCLVSLLYFGVAAFAWKRQRQVGTASGRVPAETAAGGAGSQVWTAWGERGALILALGLHGVLLHQTIFAVTGLHFGFAYALSAMLWLGVGLYCLEGLTLSLSALPVLLLPLAGICVLLPWPFPGSAGFIAADSWGFRLHLVAAILAYSLLTIAALHAILMTAQEHRLHQMPQRQTTAGGWQRLLDGLPPLLTMERMLFRMLLIGFVLLSLTLLSGVVFSEVLWQRAFKFDHKTLFAVLSWLIFGALLIGRWVYGWRGRMALRWTLAGFAALILAYIGSRFVLEVILHRV